MNTEPQLPAHESRTKSIRRAVFGVGAVAAAFALSSCSPEQVASKEPVGVYTVKAGDTLSGIAEKVCLGDEDDVTIRNRVVDLQIANDLSSSEVHEDQTIKLPANLC